METQEHAKFSQYLVFHQECFRLMCVTAHKMFLLLILVEIFSDIALEQGIMQESVVAKEV